MHKFKFNYLINTQTNSLNQLYLVSKRTIQANQKQCEVIIPKAIKRGPTDILKTLSSTVKKDYSGPHYKYTDDPYLTPVNNVDKRSFSLAKESGRKAAQYFIDKYPEFFHRDISEPKIEAFTYKEIYDDSMEFDELDFQKSITRCDVSNAIICYNNLVKQNKKISEETINDFLDLVCFFNCQDATEHYAEEEWFKKSLKEKFECTWKDNGFAEQLFESIEPKTSRAFSSIIQGMAKYNQTERAFSFYKQALDLQMKLNVATYNSLINASYNLHQNNDDRWATVIELLHTMRKNEIKPNLGTLNSALKQLSKYKFWNLNTEFAKKTFNEFAFKFDIKPSLATYYHLLNVFYKSRNSRSYVIYEIMDKISKIKFEIQDNDDVNFFSSAMEIASNLNDIQLAHKINELAEKNAKLIGTVYNQNNFYNKYLKLLCSSETIENFMNSYNKYVPHSYTPNIELMDQILKTFKIYKSLNYIPQIHNDIVLFAYTNRIEILQDLLSIMDEIKKEDPLLGKFNEMVLDIFKTTNTKIDRYTELGYSQNLQWTSKALSYCISILLKADNFDSASEILRKMDDLKNEIFDQPESQPLIDFCLYALSEKNYDQALFCLEYCRDISKDDVLKFVKKEIDKNPFENETMRTTFDRIFLNIKID